MRLAVCSSTDLPKCRVYNRPQIKTRSSPDSRSFFAVTWPSRNTVSSRRGASSAQPARSSIHALHSALVNISKSISLYLHDDTSTHRTVAIDLCARGFHIWQHYTDSMTLLRALFALATNMRKDQISVQNAGPQARSAVLHIAMQHTALFMTVLTLDILNPRSVAERKSVMQLVAFLIRKVSSSCDVLAFTFADETGTATADTIPTPSATDGGGGQVSRSELDSEPRRRDRHCDRNYRTCRQNVRRLLRSLLLMTCHLTFPSTASRPSTFKARPNVSPSAPPKAPSSCTTSSPPPSSTSLRATPTARPRAPFRPTADGS